MDNEKLNVTPEEVVNNVEEVVEATVSEVEEEKNVVEKFVDAAGDAVEMVTDVASDAAEKFEDKVEAVAAEVIDNPEVKKANGMSIAGLVLGIIAILISCCSGVCGLPFSIVALVLSIIGMKKQKCGLATAALVVSIIGLVICVVTVIMAIALSASGALDEVMNSYY